MACRQKHWRKTIQSKCVSHAFKFFWPCRENFAVLQPKNELVILSIRDFLTPAQSNYTWNMKPYMKLKISRSLISFKWVWNNRISSLIFNHELKKEWNIEKWGIIRAVNGEFGHCGILMTIGREIIQCLVLE